MRKTKYVPNLNMARPPQNAGHSWRPQETEKPIWEGRVFVIETLHPNGEWVKYEEHTDERRCLARCMKLRCEYPYTFKRSTYYGSQIQ